MLERIQESNVLGRMVNDVRAFAAAEVRRINSKEVGKQRLRLVIDSRNNLDIIQHLEQYTTDFKVKNAIKC